MNARELLASLTAALPKNRPNGEVFSEYLSFIFEAYSAELSKLDDGSVLSKDVQAARPIMEAAGALIVKSVESYLVGFPHAAYDKLKDATETLRPYLKQLEIEVTSTASLADFQRLYRIRVGKLDTFNRGDLFHVPFNLRHKIETTRYSIPGLPCLYLSGSLWACWEDLQRPDFHTIQMSRFRYAQPVSVLDFGFRPIIVGEIGQAIGVFDESKIKSYLICWPLMAACSIRVQIPGSPFIPEYIVPQLLLQWLRNETRLDGLRYLSTRITQDEHSPWAAMNYVFPVKRQSATGYCPILQEKFFLTAPTAWSILTSIDVPGAIMIPDAWTIGVNEDKSVMYAYTDFWRCEQKLEGMPCKSVDGSKMI